MSDDRGMGNSRRPVVRLIIILLMPVMLCAARTATIATEPVSRLDTLWWRERFDEKQMEMRHRHVDLMWLGDSITQNWEHDGPEAWRNFAPTWRRFYGDRQAINLGFRGDSTCHLIWRLEHGELEGIRPKAVILLIGANNFGHVHTAADQTYQGISVVLDILHRRLPATPVLLIGVLPSIRSSWVTTNTRLLNLRLATLPSMEGSWLHYIDVGNIFEDHGLVDRADFLDPLLVPPSAPLHPTASAQEKIAEAIEPVVAAMMGDHLHR